MVGVSGLVPETLFKDYYCMTLIPLSPLGESRGMPVSVSVEVGEGFR
jgi:hypothetical protein